MAAGRPRLAERIRQFPVRRAAKPSGISEVLQFPASPRNVLIGGDTVIADGGTSMA